MTVTIDPLLLSLAQALGVIDANGDFDPNWLEHPLAAAQTMFSDPGQRVALLDALGELLGSEPAPGAGATEQWYPLLGTSAGGNLYLTADQEASGATVLGLAGAFTAASTAQLSVGLPLVLAPAGPGGLQVLAPDGTQAALALNIVVPVDAGGPIQASELLLQGSFPLVEDSAGGFAPPGLSFTIKGLVVDGGSPQDLTIDTPNPGPEAVHAATVLVSDLLGDSSSATLLALGRLLGLAPGASGQQPVPPIPIAQLSGDPTALRTWLAAILSDAAVLATWITALCGLVDPGRSVPSAPAADGSWHIELATLGGYSAELLLAVGTGSPQTLAIGLSVSGSVAGGGPTVAAAVTLATVPLQGAAPSQALPAASIAVEYHPAATSEVSVSAVRAGLALSAGKLTPLLELDDVQLSVGGQSQSFATVDLTDAQTLLADAQSAAQSVSAGLLSQFGSEPPASQLLALLGLTPPATDSGAPTVSLATFLSNPLPAIAEVHVQAIARTGWASMMNELTTLLGLPQATGHNTVASPLLSPLASGGGLTVSLAAWSPSAEQLCLGLQLGAGAGTAATAIWLSTLVEFGLGSGALSALLLSDHQLQLTVTEALASPALATCTVSASGLSATADFPRGQSPTLTAEIDNVQVTLGALSATIPRLTFPPPAGFDLANPTASLGVSSDTLLTLARVLLTAALDTWGADTGLRLARVLGFDPTGLASDFPTPAAVSAWCADPAGAFTQWLAQIAAATGADGSSFAQAWVGRLAELLASSIGTVTIGDDGSVSLPPMLGDGTYDRPWTIELLDGGSALQPLIWFGPDGPPLGWAASAAAGFPETVGLDQIVAQLLALRGATGALDDVLSDADQPSVTNGLFTLSDHLSGSDGVVPTGSQAPTTSGWSTAPILTAAHTELPGDTAAREAIVSQIQSWSGSADHVVVMLGPAFSDASAWAGLISDIGGSSATFSFRDPSFEIQSIGKANSYALELAGDTTSDRSALVSQIAAAITQIEAAAGAGTSSEIYLVAHSTAGLAAVAYAASAQRSPQLKGLITLATPHGGAPLTPLTDADSVNALRLLERTVTGLTDSQLNAAYEHLLDALNGLAGVAAGALSAPDAYPLAAFTAPASSDTGGVQALALQSQLQTDLGDDLQSTLAALAQSAADPSPARATPTSLGIGVQLRLDLPAGSADGGSPSGPLAATTLRLDLAQLGLVAGGVSATWRPALQLRSVLRDPRAWLVGGPGLSSADQGPIATRVRWAELGLTITPEPHGANQLTPLLRLHDAAIQGRTLGVIELGDTGTSALAGDVISALSSSPQAAALIAALSAFGIVDAAPDGTPEGVSLPALLAIAADPGGYLTPHLTQALETGLFSLTAGNTAGSWQRSFGDVATTLTLNSSPWSIACSVQTSDGGLSLTAQLALEDSVAGLTGSATIGGLELGFACGNGAAGGPRLTLSAEPYLESTPLIPAPAAAGSAALGVTLLELLVAAAVAGPLTALAGSSAPGGPITGLLRSPGSWLARAGALGDGGRLSPAKVSALLSQIATALGLSNNGGDLVLPGGLRLRASAAPSGALRLTLDTPTPLGSGSSSSPATLAASLNADIDSTGHLTPSGTLTADLTLTGGLWSSVVVDAGYAASGWTLALKPAGATAITLAPTVSGLGSAVTSAAEYLLPTVLSALAGQQGATPVAWVQLTRALGLSTQGGAAEQFDATKLAALLSGDWLAAIPSTTDLKTPLKALLPSAITVTATGATLNAAPFSASIGWGSGATLGIALQDASLAPAPLTVTLDATAGATSSASLSLTLSDAGLSGLPNPTLTATLASTGGFELELLPIGSGSGNPALQLSPTLGLSPAGAELTLIKPWLLPLATRLLLRVFAPQLSQPAWSGGPTWGKLLSDAQLLRSATAFDFQLGVPDPVTILSGALSAAGTSATVSLPGGLALAPSSSGLGAVLSGTRSWNVGSYTLELLLGDGQTIPVSSPGVGITLFSSTGGSGPSFAPALSLNSVGARLANQGSAPLIDAGVVTLGAARALFIGSFALNPSSGTLTCSGLGGGVELEAVGLPLGQLLSGSESGASDNPVAASLLSSGSSSSDSTGGDPQPINPAVTVIAYEVPGAEPTFKLVGDSTNGVVWFGINDGFGPLFIDQVGVALPSGQVQLLIDGSLKVVGLDVEVQGLSLTAPLTSLGSPGDWQLDLEGLAAGFSEPGVTIAGGLLKTIDQAGAIEYDGALTVAIAQYGLTAIGAYARPGSGSDQYTSIFIVLGIQAPLGGPPYLFLTGLGAGFGYNRALIVPTDMNDIPGFPLVEAINNTDFASDPMAALADMGAEMPPVRGGLWLGAGVEFTSFTLVDTTAVAYVALNSGLEIGVLGVSEMTLPPDVDPSVALVSVQLAVKARFSTAEGVLSVQAQLTDNSWLLTPDCHLTGGFAFVIWFTEAQFVLTLGGYNPSFTPPTQFPVVPRLGLDWQVSDEISIVGGIYFALTSTCVMAGGKLAASINGSNYAAWATVYADMLISWDPVHYDFDAGISIGVRALGHTVSVSATASLTGPPLYGTVNANLELISISVSFGESQADNHDLTTDAAAFLQKYVLGNNAQGSPYSVNVNAGLLTPPSSPAGGSAPPAGGSATPGGSAPPAGGSETNPWPVAGEFGVLAQCNLPITEAAQLQIAYPADHEINPPLVIGPGTDPQTGSAAVTAIDFAAMGIANISTKLVAELQPWTSSSVPPGLANGGVTATPIVTQVPEATWHYSDQPVAGARTLPALVGFQMNVAPFEGDATPDIDLSQLVEIDTRPLPFNTTAESTSVSLGNLADTLAQETSALSTVQLSALAIYTFQNGNIEGAVVPARPPSRLSLRSLATGRSAPPTLRPLTYGMSDRAIKLPPPVVLKPWTAQRPVVLRAPRERPTLAARLPASGTVALPRLTVSAATKAQVAAPPSLPAAWAQTLSFTRVSPSASAQPRMLRPAPTTLSAGDPIAAGASRSWDLPGGSPALVRISGTGGFRLTAIDAAGAPCADEEHLIADGEAVALQLPRSARRLIVTALGVLAGQPAPPQPGIASLTGSWAAPGELPVCGWQLTSRGVAASTTTLLARGAVLRLPRVNGRATRRLARIGASTVVIGTELATVQAVETMLPARSSALAVAVAGSGIEALADIPLVVTGGRLGSSQTLRLGSHTVFVTDVEPLSSAAALVIAAGTRFTTPAGAQAQLAGVVAMESSGVQLATALTAQKDLVGGAALSGAGWVAVEFASGSLR